MQRAGRIPKAGDQFAFRADAEEITVHAHHRQSARRARLQGFVISVDADRRAAGSRIDAEIRSLHPASIAEL